MDKYQALRDRYHSKVYSRHNILDGEFRNVMVIYDRMYGKYMPRDKGAHILDLGCGAGQFIKFCDNNDYRRMVGVDISREQIDYCQTLRLKSVGVEFVLGDVFDFLQITNEKFDLVVGNDFIEHITKARGIELVGLIHGALEPGGRIMLKTGNMAAFGGLAIWCNGLDHECGYTERSLEALLGIWGFEEIEIAPYRERKWRYNLSQWAFHRVLRVMYKYLYAGGYPKYYDKIIAVTGIKPR